MTVSPERASSPANVNGLFDYDVGLEDIFQGANESQADNANDKPQNGDPSSLGLGLDEEVKVTKKRQPVAKLDENRLLSQLGVPKLRRAAKQKLKFKGKGHEFSDAARLLNFYQLWLDDLFPRAKFADGLAMIEKLGHSKRIQTMRREWIEEEKPKLFADTEVTQDALNIRELPTRISFDQNGPVAEALSRPVQDGSNAPNEQLFIADPEGESRLPTSNPEPDDDDLEDLLREQDDEMSGAVQLTSRPEKGDRDDFDAEYEAMNELGL
ncbi:Chromosome segregation in meiosis protein 3 [Penicillium argentinense]|uniref:Chromosome segregation in meiosis protein n=1 Tax=Penicillium argentinense TaxID=1131581 RepID=A0A9W9K2J0_9EURO|nr:Chromosome segregation in meiosis protein 3 [Penicillium argentinense]KAJ5090420.1 Chromosome segregation in meiosis protein 3 [Penicillium argentinense]